MITSKQQQTIPPHSNSGFTIVESLVAIVVVAILMAAIAPVLVMSTSIRVQARRVELSTQAVKTFIDGVRNGSITKPPTVVGGELSSPTTTSPRNISTTPNDYLINTTEMPALSSSSATDLYCYKQDGKIGTPSGTTSNTNCSNNQFYIQARKIAQGTGNNDGFRMAMRVYRSDLDFSKPVKISTGASTKKTASSVTGRMGDKQAPLIEMTIDIGNSSTSFQALCQRLGAAPGTTLTCE
jgi:prepilin-type N-terminal cleavage/methylation domain-containing protein